jgi:hypothetical protein
VNTKSTTITNYVLFYVLCYAALVVFDHFVLGGGHKLAALIALAFAEIARQLLVLLEFAVSGRNEREATQHYVTVSVRVARKLRDRLRS